jgi:hypothetical protein
VGSRDCWRSRCRLLAQNWACGAPWSRAGGGHEARRICVRASRAVQDAWLPGAGPWPLVTRGGADQAGAERPGLVAAQVDVMKQSSRWMTANLPDTCGQGPPAAPAACPSPAPAAARGLDSCGSCSCRASRRPAARRHSWGSAPAATSAAATPPAACVQWHHQPPTTSLPPPAPHPPPLPPPPPPPPPCSSLTNPFDTNDTLPLSASGWPQSLPPGRLAHKLAVRDVQLRAMPGRYLALYDGDGTVELGFDAKVRKTSAVLWVGAGEASRAVVRIGPNAPSGCRRLCRWPRAGSSSTSPRPLTWRAPPPAPPTAPTM